MAETIHTHVSHRFRVNFWMGSLVYRHSFRCHAKTKTALAPEPVGHLSHVAGTITAPVEFKISPQMPRENGDSPIPNILYEAETLKPTIDMGQQGRMIWDHTVSTIVRPVDTLINAINPTGNRGQILGTARNWSRGKTFGGGRGLHGA